MSLPAPIAQSSPPSAPLAEPDRQLVLTHLHGRDASGAGGKPLGRLHGVTLSVPAGLWAVLGTPADGCLALHQLIAGTVAPSTGTVRLAGRDPWRSPWLRAHMGVLGRVAELPEAATAAGAAELAARIGGWDATGLLEQHGLSGLGPRPFGSLRAAEARALELAIALGQPLPWLLALWEPFRDVAGLDRGSVRQHLRERAAQGCCVMVFCSCPDDVIGLTEQVVLMHRGRWIGPAGGAPFDGAPAAGDLVLWVDPVARGGGRALATALLARHELGGVGWQAGADATAPQMVAVRAVDLDAAALAVAEECARLGTVVHSVHSGAPTLEQLVQQTLARERAVAAGGGR